ncbi:NitT/TauT family transport system permease protein [Candidatus Hakubella thermalkaliphila]|uniref:NitT/TauT family transport system permease protein n=3 Tax=Candidatus Hakubella thermalkaliphila TaxID=2754717 RepID=A0A6V8PIQ6_9ACTN|nr:ABC transporter permease [Candidatus Hakubella thermalkaliphila]GFP32138.1 NitT/TauT family transport system permease protein [Candidatus Hakubella thermalkaliphila]GFP35237.1 NitT/TauT family transport system permease protein [Candidatus Hakubella thermalkaliphila]
MFPAPLSVLQTLVNGFMDRTFLIGIAISMRRITIGYGISVIAGILLGLLIGRVKLLDETVGSLVLGLQTLPSITWLPLALLWFGLNEKAIIFVVIMGAVFSITIGTYSGVKGVPPLYLKAGRNMGAQGYQLFLQVIIPAALPSIVVGLKQGWSWAWRSLMAGELLFVSLGLGFLLMMGRELNDMSQVIAVMIIIIIIGLVVDKLIFAKLERNLYERWGLDLA